MTNTFRKHHKTIMWIIIVGTIVSFVYFLSPTARNNGGGGGSRAQVYHGAINGEPVPQAQWDAAVREARLVFRFSEGRWPKAREEDSTLMTNTAYQRLLIEAEMKDLKLEVTAAAAAQYTRNMLGIRPGDPFPQDKFNDFVAKDLNQEGHVTLDDFDRFVHNEVGQQMLMGLFGSPGQMATQKEAEYFFRRENESMQVEVAHFYLTNFTDRVTVTPDEVEQFYAKNVTQYRLPERRQVNFINFEVTNFMAVATNIAAGITNFDRQVDLAYENQDPGTFKDETGAQMSPEAAKAKLKQSYYLQLAANAAQTNAMDLAHQLLDNHPKDQPVTKQDLERLAASNHVAVISTEPFDPQTMPTNLALASRALPILFQLQFGDPTDQCQILPGTNSYYLVALEKVYPSQDQPLETVRAKVTEDCRTEKALEKLKATGTAFDNAMRAGLAKGQTFEAICAAQGVKPQTLTPFTAATKSVPEITDNQEFETIVRLAYEVPTGKASPFVLPALSGGFLVYVQSRSPVDDAVVQRDIPTYLNEFRRKRQIAAYQEWLQREFSARISFPKAG